MFLRCAPECIDVSFAKAVLTVYKNVERVPADPSVASDVVESIRAALKIKAT